MYVKPQGGLKIPMELGGFLPPEGAEVKETSYWLRLLKNKSIALAAKPLPKVAPEVKGKGEKK
jgi:hypothetical protein